MILGGGLPGKVGGCQLFENGRLAQLGERLPYKQDVIGSSPIVSTTKSQSKRLALFCYNITEVYYVKLKSV